MSIFSGFCVLRLFDLISVSGLQTVYCHWGTGYIGVVFYFYYYL